jgi:hypothetical protein
MIFCTTFNKGRRSLHCKCVAGYLECCMVQQHLHAIAAIVCTLCSLFALISLCVIMALLISIDRNGIQYVDVEDTDDDDVITTHRADVDLCNVTSVPT